MDRNLDPQRRVLVCYCDCVSTDVKLGVAGGGGGEVGCVVAKMMIRNRGINYHQN